MRGSMSGLDIRVIATELEKWKGAYVKKCYQPHYEQIVLRLNPKEGKQFDLIIIRGKRVYTSQRDRPMPMQPGQFAMLLRKNLRNSRLTGVEQLGFDRVLRLSFDTKEGKRTLMIEMFRDGNVMLLDENGIIIQPLTHTTYSHRTIKRGHEYVPPPEAVDPHELTENDVASMLENSDRDLVRTLAGKANLGGGLSEAVVREAGFDNDHPCSVDDADVVHRSLNAILSRLKSEAAGHIILKSLPDVDLISPGLERDELLAELGEEVTPILLATHSGKHKVTMSSLCEAVDAWKGAHDAIALARREAEKANISAPGRGVSTPVERLERRFSQQQNALEGFSAKVEKQQALGHAIQDNWVHVESLLTQVNQAVDDLGWEGVKKSIKQIEWIESVDPANKTIMALLPNEAGEPGLRVVLFVEESVHQNAQRQFEAASKQKNKTVGAVEALEQTKLELKRAKKKEEKMNASGQLQTSKRSKRLWFENHRWSIMPGGHLLVGGRDAKGNDSIVKKHLIDSDRYLHADIHGAPSCSLRSNVGFVPDPHPAPHLPDGIPTFRLSDKVESQLDEKITEDSARLALAWSRAWNSGGGHGTVYWVKPAQVSKTAETGESLGRGAFVIRGQRTWFKDIDLKLGLGLIAINGVPLILASTPEYVSEICTRWMLISPGRIKREEIANRIYRATGIATDDILPVIPGNCEIIEDKRLLSQ